MIAALKRVALGVVLMMALCVPLRPTDAVTQSVLDKVQAARAAAQAGHYASALDLAEKALAEHRKRSGHELGAAAFIEFDIATYLVRLRRYDDALGHYRQAVEGLQADGDDSRAALLPVL